ncbi:MAG: TonB-dependent receptor [Thermodesulfobacteriota bacterium]|nr:TonB-dependent receptor [Thermodesulfobacteriota bacterium]
MAMYQRPKMGLIPVLLTFALLVFQGSVFAAEKGEVLDLDLLDMSLEELLEIEVTTASKRAEKVHDAPGIVTVITAKEIEQFGAVNLMDVLERAPHFYPIDSFMHRQNTTSVRGIAATHLNTQALILINHRPVRESQQGGADFPVFQAFPLEVIDRIEFVRGPGSVLYGTNAVLGVINIITKKKVEDPEFQASANYGTFDTIYSSMAGGKTSGDWQVYGGLKYLDSDGWGYKALGERHPFGGDNTYIEGDYDETHLGAMLYANYRDLTLNAFYADNDQTVVGALGIPPLDGYEFQKLMLDVGYTHDIRDDWDVSVNATYHMGRSGFPFLPPPQPRKTGDTDDYVVEATTRMEASDKLNLLLGGTVYYQTGENYVDDLPSPQRYQIPEYSNDWYTGYVQADYQLTDKLKVIAGAQANKVETQGWDVVPRLGAVVHFTERLGAKVLYGEAYRSPYVVETVLDAPGALIGNPDLDPEMIETLDAQVFYSSGKYQLALTGYQSKMKDLIRMVPTPDPAYQVTFANVDEITAYGLELEAKYIPTSELYFLGSICYQVNEDDNDVKDITRMPNWSIKAGVFYQPIPAISLGIFDSYYSKPTNIYSDSDYAGLVPAMVNEDPDSFHWLTAKLTFDLSELMALDNSNLELNVFAENLFDEDVYVPEIYRKQINSVPGRPGRFIGAGLTMKF